MLTHYRLAHLFHACTWYPYIDYLVSTTLYIIVACETTSILLSCDKKATSMWHISHDIHVCMETYCHGEQGTYVMWLLHWITLTHNMQHQHIIHDLLCTYMTHHYLYASWVYIYVIHLLHRFYLIPWTLYVRYWLFSVLDM